MYGISSVNKFEPVVQKDINMKEKNTKESNSTNKKPIKVLHIEDDGGLAYLIQSKLALKGYFVDIARDGEEGLEMY